MYNNINNYLLSYKLIILKINNHNNMILYGNIYVKISYIVALTHLIYNRWILILSKN